MTINISAEAQRAEDAYWSRINKLAKLLTSEHVVPFCIQHKLTFVAGMGTWCWRNADRNVVEFDDKEIMESFEGARELHDLMTTQLMNGLSLGLMNMTTQKQQMTNKAFDEGYVACVAGTKKIDNPHNKGFFRRTKKLHWEAGWETAHYDKQFETAHYDKQFQQR